MGHERGYKEEKREQDPNKPTAIIGPTMMLGKLHPRDLDVTGLQGQCLTDLVSQQVKVDLKTFFMKTIDF